jgi:hypothetical protein
LEESGVQIWLDERELRVGDSVARAIREGIDKTDYFMVVLSSASSTSEWVQREIDIATTAEIETNRTKVLPALLGDVTLPALLKGKFYADFRKSYRDGLHAMRHALGMDLMNLPIMLGCLIKGRGIDGLIHYLRRGGYRSKKRWPICELRLELASGYFAYMRGDRHSSAVEPSLFQPQTALALREDLPILHRDPVTVAFGEWRDEKFRNQGITGDLNFVFLLPEWRNVLYILGPAAAVHASALEILEYHDLPNGARYDLELALKWWKKPKVLPGAISVTVLPK